MKTKTFQPVKFYYDKSMLPYFNEGKKQFCKQTMIVLDGISWEIQGEQLVITIQYEQNEQYLFHLAFCIGTAYAKMKEHTV